jgi:hypothetical protein
MEENLGLRLYLSLHGYDDSITEAEIDEIMDYTTDVPVFSTGAEAALHGLSGVENPSLDALKLVAKLQRRLRIRFE